MCCCDPCPNKLNISLNILFCFMNPVGQRSVQVLFLSNTHLVIEWKVPLFLLIFKHIGPFNWSPLSWHCCVDTFIHRSMLISHCCSQIWLMNIGQFNIRDRPWANKDSMMPMLGGKKKKSSESSYFMKHIFTLVSLYVSIFTEIPLTPASLLQNEMMDITSWNAGLSVLKTRNGVAEVYFESRTAQMSALFHIFTCTFCLL